ncbi:Na+/H+ antiporter NhaA [Geodermatophilus normandii]|uniref:Na(+)/H(+) antiporter NhaA n=1 Tax=Geodermatophilus normandii TaxID=1137989 RepID=A0A317QFX8_9ACTN|nr:Na+/H+ antiporter NhaA [Geodermatophilus normandii]PWW21215.1 Na+/H+ antiporter NhaA [Geodermatophilus normandii]
MRGTARAEETRPSALGRLVRLADSDAAAAGVLLAATLVALVWANVPGSTYEATWHTPFAVRLGDAVLEMDLRHWVNDALMAVFFCLISLEVKRDLVLGEFRDTRRIRIPVVAALAGLAVPALVFLAVTGLSDQPGEARAAWGVVISTDTAFVLGLLAVVGRSVPVNLRAFVLALSVVDDVGALAVIAVAYTDDLTLLPLAVAVVGLVAVLALRRLRVWRGWAYLLLAVPIWLGVLASGVHPTVAGVAIGLLLPVNPFSAEEVDAAEAAARAYGRTPTSSGAHRAVLSLTRSVSVNERGQRLFRPWVNLAVVPVFALANAGVVLSGETLAAAATSGLTWAIVAGLVVGKVVGVTSASLAAVRLGLGRLPSGLFPRHVIAAGVLSGIGFTISLFIIDLALDDPVLAAEARIGVLAASVVAALLALAAVAVVRAVDRSRLPGRQRLARPVRADRDHVRGRVGAPMELVVYASFVFTNAGRTAEVVDELRQVLGEDLVFVYRHLLTDDPASARAAEAAEAAHAQSRFWPMHDAMAARAGRLDDRTIRRCAVDAGLNLARVDDALASGAHADRVREDDDDARAMALDEPPRFFVNGQLYDGPFDVGAMRTALEQTAGRSRSRAVPAAAPADAPAEDALPVRAPAAREPVDPEPVA